MVSAPADPIEFWFDFSSPYGYFASFQIDDIARDAGREVYWRPFLLGAVFKETGGRPLVDIPIKGEYSRLDWERLARYHDVAFTMPHRFPVATTGAARAFYWIDDDDANLAKRFAKACYAAYFGDDRDISDNGVVAAVGEEVGLPTADVRAAIDDERWKAQLRDINALAMEKGVFGSPFFIVDGERFWGSDRMPMFAEWLSRGGW